MVTITTNGAAVPTYLVDPATGLPYSAAPGGGGTGLTDAELRASAISVNGPTNYSGRPIRTVGTSSAGPPIFSATYTVTRPADTTAYANNDVVANSTVAGSVVPITFDLTTAGFDGRKVGFNLRYHTNGPTTTAIGIAFFTSPPALVNGDNGPLQTSNQLGNYFGSFATSPDTKAIDTTGTGTTWSGTSLYLPAIFYGILYSNGGFTPTSGQTFTLQIAIDPF